MSITLSGDNRILTSSTKYSYLLANYVSFTTNLSLLNATDSAFAPNAYLLLGTFGSETAEVVQISTINNTTGAIVLFSATKFAHSESTKVSVLPYNQIRFFWTPIESFSMVTPLTGYVDIQPSDWFTTFDDGGHSSGYGWFIWWNSTTNIASQESNSLPYGGFERSSIEDLLNDFYSLLNNKELKLVTRRDALSWLNEANSKVRNRLNLANREYSASALDILITQPGVYEYDLPKDFYQLLSIQLFIDPAHPNPPPVPSGYWDNSLEYISLREAFQNPNNINWPKARYYIRGKKIGILPGPTDTTKYSYMYLTKTQKLTGNSDEVEIPDNGEYILKDWMCFRAFSKFGNPIAATYYKTFTDGLNDLVISAIDRDANLDWTDIVPEANC